MPIRLVACLLAGLITLTARAAEPIRLCTASPTGTYVLVGGDIRDQAARAGLGIDLVESEGSMDNLSRLASGKCDAAIVQADAYLLFQEFAGSSRLEIRRPIYLYDEIVHLVCHRRVGAARLADLPGLTPPVAIAVGDPGSGSALTWGALGVLDDRYGAVEQKEVGGAAALAAIESGEGAGCLFDVSAPGSPWMRDTVAGRSDLVLVPIEDRGLPGASIAGIAVYERYRLDGDVYPSLMPAGASRLDTLSVRAVLVMLESWARAEAGAASALAAAVEAARPAIASRIGSR